MYMSLKPNQHKITSFNTTTMTSLGFIGPPPKKILGLPLNLAPPPNLIFLFWSEIFRSPPPKIRGGCYHAQAQ